MLLETGSALQRLACYPHTASPFDDFESHTVLALLRTKPESRKPRSLALHRPQHGSFGCICRCHAEALFGEVESEGSSDNLTFTFVAARVYRWLGDAALACADHSNHLQDSTGVFQGCSQ